MPWKEERKQTTIIFTNNLFRSLCGCALVHGMIHIPFMVLNATPNIIEAKDKDIVPLNPEREAILIEIAAPAVGNCTITLDRNWFDVSIS